jgi:hypothetical protein
MQLISAATFNNGIEIFRKEFSEAFFDQEKSVQILKFVPASGAAVELNFVGLLSDFKIEER